MKKVFALTLLFIAFIAQTGSAEVKICIVDLQAALDESEAGKKAVADMKHVFTVKQKEIENKRAALKVMQDDLNNQSALLTEEAKQDKLEIYQKELKKLQRYIQDSNEEMKKKEGEHVQKIAEQLKDMVKQLGKELGYDLILEAQESGVLHNSPSIDITKLVIERFDRSWNARNRK